MQEAAVGQELVDELRASVEGEALTDTERRWLDDECLRRYLRARKLSVAKASSMLQATLKWRREFGVQELMREVPESVVRESESGKMYVQGKDKEGKPILFMRPRFQNTKDQAAQMQHLVYTLERAVALMDGGAGKLFLLIDFMGLSTRNIPSLSAQKETLNILQNHYPERLGAAVLLDAPSLFLAAYRVIKPFVDPVTREKVAWVKRPLDSDSAGRRFLRERIPAEELAAEYGGTREWSYENGE